MNHQVMANGSNIGQTGNLITTRTMIIPKPGSTNLFYLFTCGPSPGPDHYCYSIIDMNLAAGTGSVIAKKIPLWQPSNNAYKICATKHCDGVNYWIVTHECFTSVFHSYLLSAVGINTVPVISVQGFTVGGGADMKISPQGNRIALGSTVPPKYISLFDFNNATGSVGSNSIVLTDVPQNPFGLEFSPNGTIFYATNSTSSQDKIWQWNLCAGNQSAVAASANTLAVPAGTLNGIPQFGQFQLGPDGKIYVARYGQRNLCIINSPNVYGPGCNFSNNGPYQQYGATGAGLPVFSSDNFKNLNTFPSYSINCSTVQFTAPQHAQSTNGCAAIGPSLLATKWNFGDVNSGAQNTSLSLNPSHIYSAGGTYTAYVVLTYPCSSDTLRVNLNVSSPAPSFSITGKASVCKNLTQTLSVSDAAFSYTWSGISTGSAIVVSPTATTVYTVIATNTLNNCSTQKTFAVAVNACLGLSENTDGASISIYPNPGKDVYYISSSEAVLELQIMNSAGQIIEHIVGNDLKQFRLNETSSGLYLIKVKTETSVKVYKVVLE
jgi:hypothetical protein